MMNNFWVILLSASGLASLISAMSVFLTVFAYIENSRVSYSLIRDSIKVRFSKEEQRDRNENTAYVINFYYRYLAVQLSATKDKDVSKDLGISINEAKKFKSFLNQMARDKSKMIMNIDDVAWLSKRNKTYSFFNQVTSGIKNYSNHRMILMKEIQESNELTDLEKGQKILEVLQMSSSELNRFFNQRHRNSGHSLMFNTFVMAMFPKSDQEAFKFLYRTYTAA